MKRLTDRQFATLALIAETLAPSLPDEPQEFYARSAADLGVAQLMVDRIERFASPELIQQTCLALDVMEQALFNAVFCGINKPLSQMSLDERTRSLVSWADSAIPLRRKSFQGFKRLAMFLYYAVTDEHGKNPNWDTLGYQLPSPVKNVDKPLTPLTIEADRILETEVVIVGSGAGGSVVAAELAQAGQDVIIIEKGGYYQEADFGRDEQHSLEQMFEHSGFLTSHDLSISVLAGSTLGGGTTINWCGSFHTPEDVLSEWHWDFDLPDMQNGTFNQSLDAVAQRLKVNTDESQPNPQNQKLADGAKSLGYQVDVIARNVQGCQECGFCNHGCPYGAKQSTLKTYLVDAHQAGARILIRSYVERVIIENGAAIGVRVQTTDQHGQVHAVIIKAKKVVIAAGAIHTPAILLRSGLTNPHIGKNLHLHPTTVIYGLYDETICGWSGVLMSRAVKEFTNLDGRGYGCIMETAPAHPGVAAMTMSWASGYQHKAIMSKLNYLANVMIITRDRDGGRIKLNPQGQPIIHYKLSNYDAQHMMTGVLAALRIQVEAGAQEVSAPYTIPMLYRPNESNGSFESYLGQVQRKRLRSNNFALLSAHQMSTARMAGTPKQGVIDPNGQTYEVKNLFVADASALPTASGVNPMLTIMGMAHYISQRIKTS